MWRCILTLSTLAWILISGSVVFATPPVLEVSPTYLEFSAYEGGDNPANQIVSIWRGGGNGPLNWQVIEDCNWLVVEPNSGKSTGEVDDANVIVDISGLVEGIHNCYLTVDAAGAVNSPQVVDVNLYIIDTDGQLHVPSGYPTIQAAINASKSGDTVIVDQNTYYENISFGGKNIVLTSTDPNDPNVVATTIIDGAGSGSVVTFSGSEDANCVLTGFTITGGYNSDGGGIYGSNTNASIRNCRIINNQANDSYPCGGGLYVCSGIISNCVISGNTAIRNGSGIGYGGGLYACNGDIIDCEITNNVVTGGQGRGGGLCGCDGKIDRCNISSNRCGNSGEKYYYGGGLYGCDGDISNSIISQNICNGYGAGGLDNCDGGTITNCVTTGNTSSKGHGGISVSSSSITNCIVWGNSPDQIGSSYGVRYSCIQGGCSGVGNIDADPLFDADGYHLLVGSPCIDAGDPTFIPAFGETDIDGEPRLMGLRVDMGVDEFTSTLTPIIGISPTEFEFNAIWGGVDPDPQVLAIQNIGAGTLNWQITEGCFWLEVDPNSGQSSGEVNEVTISVDISGLDYGIYDCNLTILDPCAFNSPQIIPVHLYVIGSIIEVSATDFEFYAIEGGANPDEQILSISNSGTGTLNWQISEGCSWLSAEPNSGSSTGGADDVNLSVDISGLSWGYYNCELMISDPNAENSPQTIGVTLSLSIDAEDILLVPLEYPTIQAAIDVAVTGDTVAVAPGTYTGSGNKDLDFGGKAITVRSTNPEDPCVVAATIIDCQNSGRGFYFNSSEGSGSIVSGVTITRGRVTGNPARGGGIYCGPGTRPYIENCIISNNLVQGSDVPCSTKGRNAYGGGIYCDASGGATITNCIFKNNRSNGGDITDPCCEGATGGDGSGGAIYAVNDLTVNNCLLYDNYACYGGGQATFPGNNFGSGIYTDIANISNCTIINNGSYPDSYCYEIYGLYGSVSTVVNNCIIWGHAFVGDVHGDVNLSYSCTSDSSSGPGVIHDDPCFVSGPQGDYYLSQISAGQAVDSPCVDSGSDTAANLEMDIFTTRTDHIGDAGTVDMGYHYPMPNPADINGGGDVDFVDFAILASQWLDAPGVPSADIAPPGGDGIVDGLDLGLLVHYWLW